MNKFESTWLAFLKRNIKFFTVCLAAFLFFWNSVAIGEWLYSLFGAELRGYGPAQQRWHRVWATGVAGAFVFGVLVDVFNMWYQRKHPEEVTRLRSQKEERKDEKIYKVQSSPMRASFVEPTATGDIVHRAELSKLEQGYVLWLSQSGREAQQSDHIKHLGSEQELKQYLENNTPFRWGDFATSDAIEKNR